MQSVPVCTWQKTNKNPDQKNQTTRALKQSPFFLIEGSHKIKEGLPEALGRTKQTFAACTPSLTEGTLRQMVLQAQDVSTQPSANRGLFRAPGWSRLWSEIPVSCWMWYLLEMQISVSRPTWWIEILLLHGFVLVGLWDRGKLSLGEKSISSVEIWWKKPPDKMCRSASWCAPMSCGDVVSEHFQAMQGGCFTAVLWTGDEFLCTSALHLLSDPSNGLCDQSCWYWEEMGCPKGHPHGGERGAHPKTGVGWAHCSSSRPVQKM